MRWTLPLLLLVLPALGGCGASFLPAQRIVRSGGADFRVGALSQSWRRVDVDGDRIGFHHVAGGTISAGASCEGTDDVSLEVLTNHLLFGFQNRRITHQHTSSLDGRAALHTEARAELDGVPMSFVLIVVKKDGCLFDLQLVGTEDVAPARAPDFARFWGGFQLLARR